MNVHKSGHIWSEVFSKAGYEGPAMPLIFMFWFVLLLIIFQGTFYTVIYYITPKSLKLQELELDEDIENFYRCLDDHDRNWSIKEEENARENLKMEILLDETLDKMKNTSRGKKTI